MPSARTRKRWWRSFQRASTPAQVAISVVVIGVAWLAANLVYQIVRKPSELFFPVDGVLFKAPAETWASYASIFKAHSTAVMTPDLLAALAQVETSGNPIARTYWRWSFTPKPFELYRPASSAVGLYQITDGTFTEARRYCIHDHVVVEDGPWNAPHTCWLNVLYTRIVPTHAVEMTSAYLDRNVATILARHKLTTASLKQKQQLAAVIHLCGAAAGETYARRGLRLQLSQRCGDHDVRGYLQRVESMQKEFLRLAKVD